jgi:hypothetical protein
MENTEFERMLADLVAIEESRLAHKDNSDVVSSEREVLQQIREAQERLSNDPSLFSRVTEDIFTYDDPILALAAYVQNNASEFTSEVYAAGEGKELRNASWWPWAKTLIHAFLSRGDRSFVLLGGRTPTETVVLDKHVLSLAITGDAGYKGTAQEHVLRMIKSRHNKEQFDLLIHLGDIYFAGSGNEMLKNFLSPFMSVGPRVFTLLGNHDLYLGAEPYNDALNVLHQPGRFFCIENKYWRIACLDTSLAAERLLRNEGLLDPAQVTWLYKLIDEADGKGIILMSHHPVISGWGSISPRLKSQLAPAIDSGAIFAWYWGHEHCCATYDKANCGFYGACVGNGAFTEVWKAPNREPLPNWHAPGRCECYSAPSEFWPHGYLELNLSPTEVEEIYHLEDGQTFKRILSRK